MAKLTGYKIISGILHCQTGLRIGGSKETMDIGGTDNPIIRNPVTNLPYIPGSSIKGKMRSLLELQDRGDFSSVQKGRPCDCGECDVCIIFGCGSTRNVKTITRAIFRDCHLTENSLKILSQANEEKGIAYSETKTEVAIDRKKGTAISPRVQDRVPEGTEFYFEVVLRVFDDDDTNKNIDYLKKGIHLLEKDCLGGSGSRGYGKVKIKELRESNNGKE